jgi:Arc/MetJ family transcription regulator
MAPRRKTTVELDPDALAAAEAALGTKGVKQTIDVALREVARQAALRRGADYLEQGRQQLPSPAEWSAARDPRV